MSSPTACDYCGLPVRGTRVGDAKVYCCFGCSIAAEITKSRGEEGHVNEMIARLGVAGFLSMIVMVLAVYLYGEAAYLTSDQATEFSRTMAGLARYAQLLLTAPVLYLLALPIFLNALDQLRRRAIATDALIVIGVGAAYAFSVISTYRDAGATYYETACMILVFVTLGRWFEASGRFKASQAVRALEKLVPDEIVVTRDGHEMAVKFTEVLVGDVIRAVAGERIAVDGVVIAGEANVDEQLLTGESSPVARHEGSSVSAGTANLDGTLTIRATAIGADSTISRLVALLEQAKEAKGRYERWSDRVVSKFVLFTIALAIVGAAMGWVRGGAGESLMTALAVLLIACPCALGIATPMAIWIALGRAARYGVIFRGGEALERLAAVRVVFFDKTGTLTTGRMQLESIAPNDSFDKPLSVAAGLSAGSRHSISRAIENHARASHVEAARFDAVRTIPGMGLVASNGGAGAPALGSVDLMRDRNFEFDDEMTAAVADNVQSRRAVACVGWENRVRGVFGLSEALRDDAASTIAQLKSMGLNAMVLTGDHKARADAIGESLGVLVHSELRPEIKVSTLARYHDTHGVVAMVGDGLNDAPAMAAADVGIAMGCGADVTRDAGDVCLLSNQLVRVPRLIALARKTVRTVRVNLLWALLYNGAGMGLAVAGKLNPLFAAAAMAGSSLFVVANSLRLGGFAMEQQRDG
ncbi:MAG: cation-translocating P-type ATPase [Phycisphaerales bacterium]|nr:cation-translocating P-type ATPase [Phycisphaerales bacterium]MCB9855706.1 cation-translocating P-type ATPase [Phycisphaerales bacterium]MCB9862601.1 cation-translocating P-type ATPase [Phycisphaerales bacterium]